MRFVEADEPLITDVEQEAQACIEDYIARTRGKARTCMGSACVGHQSSSVVSGVTGDGMGEGGVGEGGEGSVRVIQQSSVASVNGVGEGGEGSVCMGQQSSVASVNGVGEGGGGKCAYGSVVVMCGVRSLWGWDGYGWSW